MSSLLNINAASLYDELFSLYGNTQWWPGETGDEIILGAILTQNTSWSNVEKSLSRIRNEGLMKLEMLADIDKSHLIELIHSSGFYNQKARTIIELSKMIVSNYGGIDAMKNESNDKLEAVIKPISGIGQETMDAILCYALDKPVFVVDKYTLRLMDRLGVKNVSNIRKAKEYVLASIGEDLGKLKNLHGLIVNFSKDYCRSKPACNDCPLRNKCDFASGKQD